jgi:hypothetical protein
MARIVVTPDVFTLVEFDAARIAEIAGMLASDAGIADDREVRIVVDETTPFGRARVDALEPLTIAIEGGALEDPKRPKKMSEQSSIVSLGRILFRAADRVSPGFADAPDEDKLTAAQGTAWDAYALGRCSRHGHAIAKPRWQYHFRTRHGFTDLADSVFERLWAADGLGWSDLEAACAETGATERAAAGR